MTTAVAVAVADGATRQKILDAMTEVTGAAVNYQQTLEAVLGLRPYPQICLLDAALVPAVTPAALFDAVEQLRGAEVLVIVLCDVADRVLTRTLFQLGATTLVKTSVSAISVKLVVSSAIASLDSGQNLYKGSLVF